MTHTAAPAPTAPATPAGAQIEEVTMSALTAARARVDAAREVCAYNASCAEDAFGEDVEMSDEDIADEAELVAALAALRALEAQPVTRTRWVVLARNTMNPRTRLRCVVEATDRADAWAQASARWARYGTALMIDTCGEVIG